jgi:hypothetical protein
MYPTTSEPACDTVYCQLARLRYDWEPVAGLMIVALIAFVVGCVVVVAVTLTLAIRHAGEAHRVRARRAVNAWMAAVVDAQNLLSIDPADDVSRMSARRDLLRSIAIAEGASALDEIGHAVGAGERVRGRIMLASEAAAPDVALSQLRQCRAILRAWVDGDADGLRRRYT